MAGEETRLNDDTNRIADQGFDLASILNILWRRRIIALGLPLLGLLVGVAYGIMGTRRWEALATIRPGITAFDPSGGPARQWQQKDITRWYDLMLYRKDLEERLGLPAGSAPMIRTEFIAQGLTNLAGGEVISLWTTATSPEMAAAVIDTSLVLFNEYAEADSVSSQIKLTRDGLLLQAAELENRLAAIDLAEEGVLLQLGEAEGDSLVVAEKSRNLVLELESFDRKREYFLRRVEELKAERPRLESELEGLEAALARAGVSTDGGRAFATSTGVVEGLLDARLRLQENLSANKAVADSMLYNSELAALDKSRLAIEGGSLLMSEMRSVERKIGDLRLKRKLDLPSQRRSLHFEIDARRSKLGLLSPTQRVGGTVVSDNPVRPRPLRAMAILVFLGTLGGLVLAFVWDYVSANRRKIFRS